MKEVKSGKGAKAQDKEEAPMEVVCLTASAGPYARAQTDVQGEFEVLERER